MAGPTLIWRATLRRGRRACAWCRGHDGAWPSIWSLLVELVDRFAAVAGDQVHVERRVDVVRDAPHARVAEHMVDHAGVVAAGAVDPISAARV